MANHLNLLSYHKTFHLTFPPYCKWQSFLSPSLSLICTGQIATSLYVVLAVNSGNRLDKEKKQYTKDLEEMEIDKMDISKRKNGIFKKAHKLTLLCDAEVSIIMLSSNNELMFEYTSPTSTMKKMIDQYQSRVGVDLWSSHYERMQEELIRLEDVNATIRREIMKRKGEELDHLNMEQLCNLEEEMLLTLNQIQARKYRLINIQMDTSRKKVRFLEEMQKHLLHDLEMEYEYQHGGVVVDEDEDEDSAAAFAGRFDVRHASIQREDDEDEENSCLTTAAMEVEDSV